MADTFFVLRFYLRSKIVNRSTINLINGQDDKTGSVVCGKNNESKKLAYIVIIIMKIGILLQGCYKKMVPVCCSDNVFHYWTFCRVLEETVDSR